MSTNEELARNLTEYLSGGAQHFASLTGDEAFAIILAALNEATAERDTEIARLQAQLRERTQFICQCGGTKMEALRKNEASHLPPNFDR